MASSTSRKRLAYILSDELYGPMLARLRGDRERRVLDLIDQNRGKEARQAILEGDEERRAQNRERRARRYQTLQEMQDSAADNILRIFGRKADESNVRTNVGYMRPNELRFAADATEDDLTEKAVQPADRPNANGKDINPFWYH